MRYRLLSGLAGTLSLFACSCSGGSSEKGSSFDAPPPVDASAPSPESGSFFHPDTGTAPEASAGDAGVDSGLGPTIDSGPPVGPDCDADPCMCDPPNGDLAHATPYTLGTSVSGCLLGGNAAGGGDGDFFQFTTPAGAPGGTVAVNVTNGNQYAINLSVFAGGDTTEVFDLTGGNGAPVAVWFAAAPSTTYAVQVLNTYEFTPTPYSMSATFTPVHTPLQPGGSKGSATPITVGTPVQALMFVGYTAHTTSITAWWHWYVVTLASGNATVSITSVPSDLQLEAYLYDDTSNANTIHGFGESTSPGSPITFTTSAPVTAGTYYLQIEPVTFTAEGPQAYGGGATAGALATQPYTLTVTQ